MNRHQILERVRIKVPVKTYETPHKIHGDVPESLKGKLPLFASEDGDQRYLNSGGRGILVEDESGTYRIKGVDPKGVVVKAAASFPGNIIADVRSAAESAPNAEAVEARLNSSLCTPVPHYTDRRPWNFITKIGIENSRRAFDVLGEAYDKLGLTPPCRFAASIEYPFLTHEGDVVYSEILRLADEESDLRHDEFEILMRRHLQHATPQQLSAIKRELCDLYEQIIKWHAFECRTLADARLLPHRTSFLAQNHVLARVADEKIALGRVDHTSTSESDKADSEITKFLPCLVAMPVMIMQAIEMGSKNMKYDRERFSGPYDAVLKDTSMEMRRDVFPKTLKHFARMREIFTSELQNPDPQPIDEKLMLSTFENVTSIGINQEFEERRQARYRAFEKKMQLLK